MVTANLGSSRSAASNAWEVNSTSALLFVDTTNVPFAGWYFALGVQQWGKTTKLTYDSVTTITYSLPLATTLYINAFMHGGGRDKCVQLPQILSQTPTSVQMYITWATDNAGYHSPVTWLAIGIQQWGVDYGRANAKQINYPIAFAKFVKVVALDGFNSQRINCYSSLYEEPSLTYFKFNYDSETSFVNRIAIGVQQWGTFEKCSVYVTYPIPFSAFVSVVGSIDSMDNEACQCRDVQLTKFLPWQKYDKYQGKWMAVGR